MLDQAKEYREALVEAAVELDDDALAAFLDGKEPDEATLKRLIRKAVHDRRLLSGAVRLGLQEQGRAAAARRGRRLSAVAARRAGDQGHRPDNRQGSRPQADDNAPLSLLAFKIMDDPFVGSITFCRIYSGSSRAARRAQLDPRAQGARRPHAADACQQPRRHQGSLCRRHRRAGGPQGNQHRRHACDPTSR